MKTFTFEASCSATVVVTAMDEALARSIARGVLVRLPEGVTTPLTVDRFSVSYHSDDAIELMDEEDAIS